MFLIAQRVVPQSLELQLRNIVVQLNFFESLSWGKKSWFVEAINIFHRTKLCTHSSIVYNFLRMSGRYQLYQTGPYEAVSITRKSNLLGCMITTDKASRTLDLDCFYWAVHEKCAQRCRQEFLRNNIPTNQQHHFEQPVTQWRKNFYPPPPRHLILLQSPVIH